MNALAADSTLVVDGFTITAHASVILLWQRAIEVAGSRGDSFWIRTEIGDRIESVLVRPSSIVTTSLPAPTGDAAELDIDKATNSNLAAIVDHYIKPSADIWPLAAALGLEREIRANHLAESAE